MLVDRLVEGLRRRGVDVRLNTKVESLEMDADAVISTLPTPVLARLVRDADPQYAARLSEIRYMGALCTVLSLDCPLSPVYWLNVAAPGYDFGGVIEQTNFVPPEHYGGRHIVYLSRYLDHDHPLWSMDDEDLLARQLDQLDELFRVRVRDHLAGHWIFRGRYAAPVCDLGFAARIPKFRSPIGRLYVASMCHVYPDERSVNNSVRVAAEVAAALGLDSSMVPRGLSLAGKYGG